MINIDMLDVARAVGGVLVGNTNAYIKGVSIDSKKIESNNLFIPIIGQNHDGHEFIDEVIKKNVTCFLLQKDHERPKNAPSTITYIIVEDTLKALQDLATYYINIISPYVIGITGSNGKTTAKDMLYAIMSKKYKCARTIGNQNNEIGVPLSILGFDSNIKCAIIEMGVENYGDIDKLCKIVRPNVSIITSIGSAHIANFNDSKKNIARAKLEIYTNLRSKGYMFYNKESKEIDRELRKIISSQCPCFGFGDGTDLYIDGDIKYVDGKTAFKCSGYDVEFKINTIGRHNVMNALACIGVGLHEGININDIASALNNVSFDKMRCNVISIGQTVIIDDSYKSNPESAMAAIEILKEFDDYKKIICFGDMLDLGREEISYHKELGSFIKSCGYVDEVVVVGELSKAIIEKSGGESFENHEECAKYLNRYIGSKTVILVKGSRATGMDKIVKILRKAK